MDVIEKELYILSVASYKEAEEYATKNDISNWIYAPLAPDMRGIRGRNLLGVYTSNRFLRGEFTSQERFHLTQFCTPEEEMMNDYRRYWTLGSPPSHIEFESFKAKSVEDYNLCCRMKYYRIVYGEGKIIDKCRHCRKEDVDDI